MKKLPYILLVLILLGLTIFFWYRYKRLLNSSNLIAEKEYITDTIYLEKEFKPEPAFNQNVKPKEILVYEKTSDKMISDSAKIEQKFSDQDSLFQFILERNKLQLNLFNQETGTYSSRIFPIDLESYTYNWYQGKLTMKKEPRLKIKPYAYAKYRIFHNLLDIGAGISFKTKKLDYNLGINAYHYPSYMKGIGTDLEISIKYNF